MMDLVLFRHVDLHLVYCHAGQKGGKFFGASDLDLYRFLFC